MGAIFRELALDAPAADRHPSIRRVFAFFQHGEREISLEIRRGPIRSKLSSARAAARTNLLTEALPPVL